MAPEEVLTSLHMTHPGALRPAAEVPDLTLDPVGRLLAIRSVQEVVGERHHCTRLSWTDERWTAELGDRRRDHFLIRHGEHVVGVTELRAGEDGDVEISAFGLVPRFVDCGLGGYALTLAVRRAWESPPAGGPVRRVWLRTSSLDHPNALPNCLRRGFTPFRVEVRARPDLAASDHR